MVTEVILGLITLLLAYLAKKYFDESQLKVIISMIKDIIKRVEAEVGKGNGEKKFDIAVAETTAMLSRAQKGVVKRSVFKSIPKLVQYAFNAVEMVLLLKRGKK